MIKTVTSHIRYLLKQTLDRYSAD